MQTIIDSFKFKKDGVNFTVYIESLDSYGGFADQWQMVDDHCGGVTVAVPYGARSEYRFAVPQQYTLAELSADYAKQKRANPSREAYESLQRQLSRDLSASDYGFLVSAEIDGVALLDMEAMGCIFDYSYEDEGSLVEAAKQCWDEYGDEIAAFNMAKGAAETLVSRFDAVKSFVESKQG